IRYVWQMTLSNRSNPVQSPDRAWAGPHHGRSLHWFADGAAGWRGSPMGRRGDRRGYAACPARPLGLAPLAAITASQATSARAAGTANPRTSQPAGQGHNLGPCWVREGPGPQGHERSPTVTSGEAKLEVEAPSAQAAGTTPAAGSDCGSEGRGWSGPRITPPLRVQPSAGA